MQSCSDKNWKHPIWSVLTPQTSSNHIKASTRKQAASHEYFHYPFSVFFFKLRLLSLHESSYLFISFSHFSFSRSPPVSVCLCVAGADTPSIMSKPLVAPPSTALPRHRYHLIRSNDMYITPIYMYKLLYVRAASKPHTLNTEQAQATALRIYRSILLMWS